MIDGGATGGGMKARLPWVHLLALILLLLPIFHLGISDEHDWGDDFAQYLAQARDISNGHLSDPDKEVPEHALCGPVPKSIGYSLLIAPLWGLFGNSVRPYLLLNSAVLILSAVFLFLYLRSGSGPLAALLAALLFAYDRHVLQAASEILPDLLLGCLVLLALLLMRRNNGPSLWVAAFITGCATLVKSAGWVLFATLALHLLFQWYGSRGRNERMPLRRVIGSLVLPLIIHFTVLAPWLLHQGTGDTWYAKVFLAAGLPETIMANLTAYAWTFWHFFEQDLPMWMNRILVPLVLLAIITGSVKRFRRGAHAGDLFFALWMVMLLCYPYSDSNERFLLPALPLVFRFLLTGTAWYATRLHLPVRITVASLLACFLIAHAKGLQLYAAERPWPVVGPYDPEAKEAFAALRELDPAGAVVGAGKPWVVHLFTELPVNPWPLEKSNVGPAADMPRMVLLCTDPRHTGLYDEQVLSAVRHERRWNAIWKNSAFVILENGDQTP